MKNDIVPELENDKEAQKLYEEEGLVLAVTEAICERMQKQGIKRVDLAKKMGVDKSYITNLLNGSSNMTLKTISDVLFCLDSKARILVEPLIKRCEDFSDSLIGTDANPYPRLSECSLKQQIRKKSAVHFESSKMAS